MDSNIIPSMADEMGRYWQQPDREIILIDDTHAVMRKSDFELLADYSRSIPSGVYAGKMWKSITLNSRKYLCWFSEVREGQCVINCREILIVEEL